MPHLKCSAVFYSTFFLYSTEDIERMFDALTHFLLERTDQYFYGDDGIQKVVVEVCNSFANYGSVKYCHVYMYSCP